MMNVWNRFKPFERMFTDFVSLVCIRQNDTKMITVKAAVYPQENIEAFETTDIDSGLKSIVVVIHKPNIKDFGIVPQIGDNVTLEDNSKWAVSKFDETINEYRLECRNAD